MASQRVEPRTIRGHQKRLKELQDASAIGSCPGDARNSQDTANNLMPVRLVAGLWTLHADASVRIAPRQRELIMRNMIAVVQGLGEVRAFEANLEIGSLPSQLCDLGAPLWRERVDHSQRRVRAREGDMGIIPGSMGARSYIVRGKGNPESFMSCGHGAGRAMPRTEAKRRSLWMTTPRRLLESSAVRMRTSSTKRRWRTSDRHKTPDIRVDKIRTTMGVDDGDLIIGCHILCNALSRCLRRLSCCIFTHTSIVQIGQLNAFLMHCFNFSAKG